MEKENEIETPTPDQVSIWVIEMQKEIEETPNFSSKSAGEPSCSIFRVPQFLRHIRENAFEPRVVSIGPYHHGKEHLQKMQEHKRRYLSSMLDRTKHKRVTLEHYLKAVACLERIIRKSYSETIHLTSDELVKMMVLDGCFIVEFFCKVVKLVPTDAEDPLFKTQWLLSSLLQDCLQLENQVPFVLLKVLFRLSVTGVMSLETSEHSLVESVLSFLDCFVKRPSSFEYSRLNIECNHLLDLFRLLFIPSSQEVKHRDHGVLPHLIPSLQNLRRAGVKFEAGRTNSFLDINFSDGALKIPPMELDEFNACAFLNCIAFEQCYDHRTKHFSTYAILLGCLLKTPMDVAFLRDHKIIEDHLGTDEEVAHFFMESFKNIVCDVDECYLWDLAGDVNEYYRKRMQLRWPEIKHTYFETYFSKPWSFISALAALILLLLTMIQSFFAVYAYIYPPKY